MDIEDGIVGQSPVIVARFMNATGPSKPCRTPNGKAYLRGYDGDYPLSDLEEQAFLAARHPPMFDRAPIEDARTHEGVAARIAQRILALAAAIWHNHRTGQTASRSLTAYDH